MENISAAFETLRAQAPSLEFRLDEPMKKHTSFRIGGPVRAMFFPKTAEEVILLSDILRSFGIKPLIVGNGTNLLVEDGALNMTVIKTHGGLESIRQTGDGELTAESGVLLSRLASFAQERALTGLEFAHGIPGTLGGAVSMNAGAYGGEIKDVAVQTTALDPKSGVFEVRGDDQGFSYRHSRFSDSEQILLSTVVRLQRGDAREISQKMEKLAERRRASQPLTVPSAGSTFKRPKNGYAAALIEQAGLKGYSVGGAAVSEKHAGFVVNRGGATFSDVMSVMEHVRETVFRHSGVELEPEVKIIRNSDR